MNRFQSDNLDQLGPALAAAQAEMENVVADNKVATAKYSYTYADLATVCEMTKPTLAKHNLSIVQMMVPMDPPLLGERMQVFGALRTTILHSSGQWIAGEHPIGADWGNPQSISGATTTARRYNWKGACGIAESDDDSQTAARDNQRRQPATRTAAAPAPDRGDAFDEFENAPTDDAGRRVSQREDRKEAYREAFPTPEPALGRQDVGAPQQHNWPPRNGRGLFAAVADTPAFKWFNTYGADKQFPARFGDWTNDEVAQACAAFDLETERRLNSANGQPAGARR